MNLLCSHIYVVWLLVRAVTGGASDGYGKKNSYPSEHLARTNEPEAKQEIKKYLWLILNVKGRCNGT